MSEQPIPERNGVEPEQQTAERNRAEPEQQQAPEGNRAESEPDVLEKAQARIGELEDGWRRTAAELDNFRKRCAKDLVRAREQERVRTTAAWLPVVDNLERALEHARAHAAKTGHYVVRSLEPGENWRWCYAHEQYV